jgi:hypothetical protein
MRYARARVLRPLVAIALLTAACTADAPPTGSVRSAIINGRPSGEDENAAVYIETTRTDTGDKLRCSGRQIAPGLVLTARHCVLKRKSEDVLCSADGNPLDPSDTTDFRPEPPGNVRVYYGAQKPGLREVGVREIFTYLNVNVCRSDAALLVLTERGGEFRTPIRRSPVRFGEHVSVTGWGATSNDLSMLPLVRSTIETTIVELGPGRIPAGQFSLPGSTLCFGDSGSAVLVDGAVVGVYSRIDGPTDCLLEGIRNVAAGIEFHLDLAKDAYAAIGEEPWFAGEQKPWLAVAGAACANDDACRSGRCDPTTKQCMAPCGPTGLACAAGQRCSADGATCANLPPERPAPPADSSCAAGASERPAGANVLLAMAGLLVVAAARRRRY